MHAYLFKHNWLCLLLLLLPLLQCAEEINVKLQLQILNELSGQKRCVQGEELEPLFRDNLHPDLRTWRDRLDVKNQQQLLALDFLELLHEIDTLWPQYQRNFLALVAIQANNVSIWTYPTARTWCLKRVRSMTSEFIKYTETHGLHFSDTVFVLNAYDKPLCTAGSCSAPIFSFGKCWRSSMPGVPCPNPEHTLKPDQLLKLSRRPGGTAPSISESLGLTNDNIDSATSLSGGTLTTHTATTSARGTDATGEAVIGKYSPHDDILIPVMNHRFDHLLRYTWEEKQSVAFMRAGVYPAMSANCSRVQLVRLLQQLGQDQRDMFDVGIYQNRHRGVKVKTVPAVPLDEHPRYKYLINTDGQSASWRLAKILAMDSVILKWRSPHIEYYYRSLKAGEHYVDIDAHDVVDVVKKLREEDSAGVSSQRTIPSNAQAFAYRYLSQASRAAYASFALKGYNSLFAPGEMDKLLMLIKPGHNPNMSDFLLERHRLRTHHK